MRGYHIRISLPSPSSPSNPSSPTPSTSHKHTSSISTHESARPSPFIPSSLFQPLPSHPPRYASRRNTLSAYPRPGAGPNTDRSLDARPRKDYRLGPIRVDWVDFSDMDAPGASLPKPSLGKEREGSTQRKGELASATFVRHSKSGSTDLPEGIVHIFRDYPGPSETNGMSYASAVANTSAQPPGQSDSRNHAESDDVTLAVLAVPSWLAPSDFLAFVAPAADGLLHLRMIRDTAPNRSIVVMKFRDTSHVAEFIEAYNGKPFNSMEPEACHVVRVLSIAVDVDDHVSQNICDLASTRVDGAYELPTCPVCLERMDAAVTGLVTVPCSHSFHCACLSKWGDSSTTNLWICLICGNIGCGRYGRAHAHAHYAGTTHLYALELETQRVWDYAGDGYVHRLIQNKADGKLVELPSAAASVGRDARGGPTAADALTAEKIEAIGIEYSYLLTSQLDSQRTFYEAQAAELRAQADAVRALLDQLRADADAARARAIDDAAAERARAAEVERERARADRRAEKAAELARTLAKELREERAVSEGLMKNLAAAREQAAAAARETDAFRAKVAELEDQVRDVMFFLEAKSMIENGDGVAGEAAGGTVGVAEAAESKSAASRRRKGKHAG
ncbi:zf-UBP-domain-containing protein [Epithele typhae]|uniref:zf-UBP-domain-containing protein n=1 Tax=Epithele typhae TaxID=378194 RepID=UPI00200877C6|nr:zf-UBP-domain-containing protein [Epithele typhae]KAH9940940.1 zf-UBP-domain-containing protein [Epithele typhae]